MTTRLQALEFRPKGSSFGVTGIMLDGPGGGGFEVIYVLADAGDDFLKCQQALFDKPFFSLAYCSGSSFSQSCHLALIDATMLHLGFLRCGLVSG